MTLLRTLAVKSADIDRIADWIILRGLEGAQETDLLIKFCEKCNEAELPLARALVVIDTLHPIHEGRAFRWRNDSVEEEPPPNTAPPTTARPRPTGSAARSFTCSRPAARRCGAVSAWVIRSTSPSSRR